MVHDLINTIVQILLQLGHGLRQVRLDPAIVELVPAYLLVLQLLQRLAQAVDLSLVLSFLKNYVLIDMLDSLGLVLKHFLHLVEDASCRS